MRRDRTLDVIEGYLDAYGIPLTGFHQQVREMRRRKTNYDYEDEP